MNQSQKPIRILIVDDSDLVRNILAEIFASDPQLQVVGEARNGREAVAMTESLKPDLITMDIQMPEMDGFAATEHIMAYTPKPILILSSAVDKNEQYSSMRAIALGALDVMAKPDISAGGIHSVAAELIRKVKLLSHITVISHIRGKLKRTPAPPEPAPPPAPGRPRPLWRAPLASKYNVVAVGASTGGPSALERLLCLLPADLPAGIVVVQHITRGFIGSLTDWLNSKMHLRAKVAEDGETVRRGMVYFAPDDVQMEIDAACRIRLFPELPPWGEHKPAVNHLFRSLSANIGPRAIGVILTGMGDDGAEGLKLMRKSGSYTIAQDQHTCLIYGMPRAAVECGAAQKVLPLDAIADELLIQLQD